ncbi:MAG: DUF4249 domain-containing protein [Bacteroidales bacterium]|nr:DUF4249 domain-containing protein [Bacteroidales bacterium]
MFNRFKNINIQIVVAVLGVLIFSSCRKIIGELPEFDQVPVINALLINGKPITIHVSFAAHPDTTGLPVCENANVSLFIDGRLAENMNYDEHQQAYISNQIAEINKCYRCEVVIPNHDTLSAETYIPAPSNIYNPTVKYIGGYDNEGRPYPAVVFSFDTNPDIMTYYQVFIENVPGYECPLYNPTDEVILNEGTDHPVFSNEIIQDTIYTMELPFLTGSSSDIREKYVIELRTVSEDYYTFIKQAYLFDDYINNIGNIMTGALVPQYMYSNVTNGYGIFAGLSIVRSDTLVPQMKELRHFPSLGEKTKGNSSFSSTITTLPKSTPAKPI